MANYYAQYPNHYRKNYPYMSEGGWSTSSGYERFPKLKFSGKSNYIKKDMAYQQNRYNGGANNSGQPKKRSGAKMRSAKNGNMVVVAWKATKFGMLSILVAPTKYTKEVKSKSGRVWSTGMSVSVVNKNTGETSFHFGMMEKATGKTIVKNIGWVINPNGGYGGVVAKIGGRPRR